MIHSRLLRYSYLINLFLSMPFISLAKSVENAEDPFVVVMVIKNEESNICQALDPYVREGMHSFLIYDAYSTDNTVEVLKDYFRQHNIRHGHIVQGPFENYRDTRNRALELAEECFPEATFLLMPDIDLDLNWELHNLPKLQQFCQKEKHSGICSYLILTTMRDLENYEIACYQTLLIRAHAQIRFEGLADLEYIITDAKVPSDIYFTLQLPYILPFKDIFTDA